MNRRQWKILFINPASQLGGAERSLLTLVSGLNNKYFHSCVLLCTEGPVEEELKRRRIDYYVLPIPKIALRVGRSSSLQNLVRGFLSFFAQIPYWLRLIVFVKKGGFDLIHTNGVKSHLQGCLIKLFLQKQLIWHVRDIFPAGTFIKILLVLGGLFPEAIITNSRATAIPFFKSPRTRRKVHVIYNGFDFTEWIPQPCRPELEERFDLSPEDKWIGHFGVFVPWKGQEDFLKAAVIVFSQFPKVKFFLVGDEIYDTRTQPIPSGGYRHDLEKKAQEWGIASSVVFTGFQKDVRPFLNAMDVVVHSSTSPEPFGRVLVEAMGCEKPVVATEGGGVEEIVIPHVTGRVVPMGNPQALAQEILSLLHDEPTRIQMGQRGRQEAIKKFNIQSHLTKVQDLYGQILSNRP